MNEIQTLFAAVALGSLCCWLRFRPMVGASWDLDERERAERTRFLKVAEIVGIVAMCALVSITLVIELV